MAALFEQYRPQTWSDVVGQDKVLAKIETLRKRGLGGRAYWLSGNSGAGKTTIGRLLASEIAEDYAIEERNATRMTAADVAEMGKTQRTRAVGVKTGRAFIINESHKLREDALTELLTVLEPDKSPIPDHVIWVFTTTRTGQEALFADHDDTAPLLSRCTKLELTTQGLAKPFAERARMIAQAEGLDGRPVEDYIKLAQKCKNNLRQMLGEIEAGCMLAD